MTQFIMDESSIVLILFLIFPSDFKNKCEWNKWKANVQNGGVYAMKEDELYILQLLLQYPEDGLRAAACCGWAPSA